MRRNHQLEVLTDVRFVAFIRCIRLRIRSDHAGVDLLPAPYR